MGTRLPGGGRAVVGRRHGLEKPTLAGAGPSWGGGKAVLPGVGHKLPQQPFPASAYEMPVSPLTAPVSPDLGSLCLGPTPLLWVTTMGC